MLVTCPNCGTRFQVPESALGPKGRKLRCNRCGHKWQLAIESSEQEDEFPLEMAPSAHKVQAMPPAAGMEPLEIPAAGMASVSPQESDLDDEDVIGALRELETDLDEPLGDTPAKEKKTGKEEEEEDPFAHIADLMMSSAPEPIPDVFSSPQEKPKQRRKGGLGLWLLFIILLLGAGAIGLYIFQDGLIERYPGIARAYETLGLRNKVVGAGLAFRNIDSERVMQNNSEVLIVRGVIANITDRQRDIPALRLALYNDQRTLQEKIIQPPQTMLEAKASVGFRVTLDRPDPDATHFEVTFSPAVEQTPAK